MVFLVRLCVRFDREDAVFLGYRYALWIEAEAIDVAVAMYECSRVCSSPAVLVELTQPSKAL